MRYVIAFLVGLLGIAAVILGGLDDSPGLQGIGMLIIGGAVVLAMRGQRNAVRT